MCTPSAILKTHHVAMSETFCTLLTFSLQKSARIILHLLSTALVPLQNLFQTFFMDWYDSCNAQFFVYSNLSHSGYTSCQIQHTQCVNESLERLSKSSPNLSIIFLNAELLCSCHTYANRYKLQHIWISSAGLQSQKSQYCRSTYTR